MKEWKESTIEISEETKKKMFSTEEYFKHLKETQMKFGETLGKLFLGISEELERRENR